MVTNGARIVKSLKFSRSTVVPVATLPNVHLLNTIGWLDALHAQNIIPDAKQLIEQIDADRRTTMRPFDQPARTKRLRSTYLRKSRGNAD